VGGPCPTYPTPPTWPPRAAPTYTLPHPPPRVSAVSKHSIGSLVASTPAGPAHARSSTRCADLVTGCAHLQRHHHHTACAYAHTHRAPFPAATTHTTAYAACLPAAPPAYTPACLRACPRPARTTRAALHTTHHLCHTALLPFTTLPCTRRMTRRLLTCLYTLSAHASPRSAGWTLPTFCVHTHTFAPLPPAGAGLLLPTPCRPYLHSLYVIYCLPPTALPFACHATPAAALYHANGLMHSCLRANSLTRL